MSEAEGSTSSHGYEGGSEDVLRAKYLDYCSAQVADFLLFLSPDEMYVLARDAAEEAGISTNLSYDEIVRLATDRISDKLVLPPFEVWVRDYRSHPEFYEQYLMGFWKSEEEESAPPH